MTAEELGKIIALHEMQAQGTNVTEATKGTGRSLKSFPSLKSLDGGANG